MGKQLKGVVIRVNNVEEVRERYTRLLGVEPETLPDEASRQRHPTDRGVHDHRSRPNSARQFSVRSSDD